MALNSHALSTLARTKSFNGIGTADDDVLITILINVATDVIENYCKRRFLQTAYSNQLYNGNGSDKLVLREYPVVSGETFTFQQRNSVAPSSSFDTVDSDAYIVDERAGIINLIGWKLKSLPQFYRVSYTAGYAFENTAPGATVESLGIADLEVALWKLVGKIYKTRRGVSNVVSEKVGDYSVTFLRELMIDPEIQSLLAPYRKRVYG